MREVKFSVFADLHHWETVFYSNAFQRLEKIKNRAIEENVDFVIHCGDLCHAPSKNTDIIKEYSNFPMPTYHCIGNHECEGDTYEQVLENYNLENGYYYFERNGFRFIVMDLNYLRIDGNAVHYNLGNFFKSYPNKQLVTFNEEQFIWLEKTIMESPYPCVLFSHHSLERINNGMSYDELKKVWDMLDRVNKDKQRVMMAINGHHHKDNLRIFKGIAFLDLNSATYDWIDQAHDKYPKELCESYKLVANTLVWEDPVHAVVTLREDGYIKIEGMESKFIYGIDREAAGLPLGEHGRLCTPNVLSAELCLSMKGLANL